MTLTSFPEPEADHLLQDLIHKSPLKPHALIDLGGYTNIQALSPSTGKFSFDFKQPETHVGFL